MNTEEVLQSKILNFFRFPLIVGVIFVHNNTLSFNELDKVNLPIFDCISLYFSQILGSISVPLFFLMSGFWFFYKVSFSWSIFFSKLKSRARSLLIPYLFWNLLFYLVYLAFAYSYNTTLRPITEIGSLDFFVQSITSIGATYPITFQFWFIRDLMIVIIISPCIYASVKYLRFYGIIFLLSGWLLNFNIPFLENNFMTTALALFALGSYFSINGLSITEQIYKIRYIGYIYPLVSIWDFCTHGNDYNIYIHKLGLLLAIVFFVNIVRMLFKKGIIHDIPFLTAASFFVFAIHEPWLLTPVNRLAMMLIGEINDVIAVILYFGTAFISVIIACIIYYILKKVLPTFTALITGGRG